MDGEQARRITEFVSFTGCPSMDDAQRLLSAVGWNVELAVQRYFSGGAPSSGSAGVAPSGGEAGADPSASRGGTEAGDAVGGGGGPGGGSDAAEAIATFRASTGENEAMARRFLDLTGWVARDAIALFYADNKGSGASKEPVVSEAELARQKANLKAFERLAGVGASTAVSYLRQTDFEVSKAVENYFKAGGAPVAPELSDSPREEIPDAAVKWACSGMTSQYSYDNGRSACTTIAAVALDQLLRLALHAPVVLEEAPARDVIDNIVRNGVEMYTRAEGAREHAAFSEVLEVQSELRSRLKLVGSPFEGQTSEKEPFLEMLETALLACPTGGAVGVLLTKPPESISLVISSPEAETPLFLCFDSHNRSTLGFDGASLISFPTAADLRLHLRQLFPAISMPDVAQDIMYNGYDASIVIWDDAADVAAAAAEIAEAAAQAPALSPPPPGRVGRAGSTAPPGGHSGAGEAATTLSGGEGGPATAVDAGSAVSGGETAAEGGGSGASAEGPEIAAPDMGGVVSGLVDAADGAAVDSGVRAGVDREASSAGGDTAASAEGGADGGAGQGPHPSGSPETGSKPIPIEYLTPTRTAHIPPDLRPIRLTTLPDAEADDEAERQKALLLSPSFLDDLDITSALVTDITKARLASFTSQSSSGSASPGYFGLYRTPGGSSTSSLLGTPPDGVSVRRVESFGSSRSSDAGSDAGQSAPGEPPGVVRLADSGLSVLHTGSDGDVADDRETGAGVEFDGAASEGSHQSVPRSDSSDSREHGGAGSAALPPNKVPAEPPEPPQGRR